MLRATFAIMIENTFLAQYHQAAVEGLQRGMHFVKGLVGTNDQQSAGLILALLATFLAVILIPLVFTSSSSATTVPKKILPNRPVLKIHFLPDDPKSLTTNTTSNARPSLDKENGTSRLGKSHKSPWRRRLSSFHGDVASMTRQLFSSPKRVVKQSNPKTNIHEGSVYDEADGDELFSQSPIVETVEDDEDDSLEDVDNDDATQIPFVMNSDLPDSFAPLLSSSHVEIAKSNLTADLLHGFSVNAGVRLRPGKHEIPLNKDTSRPQFILDVPEEGCRISVVAGAGSDGFSTEQDLDPSVAIGARSKPMVKKARVSLDPPLPLANVAPTLVHFPTLFEDKFMIPRLRKIQMLKFLIDFVVSISSWLERCLWILEGHCQIHLSKAQMTPVYRGFAGSNPKWRLSPAFSGHVLLFGWIPIPFINVVLPTFIIPQPHAFLDYLLSAQPLASARLKRENIAEERIVIAAVEPVEKWNMEISVLGTPPAVAVDVVSPSNISCIFVYPLNLAQKLSLH